MKVAPRSIVILDFGGQYAHLIASRIRRFGYYSEIRPCDTDPESLKGAAGIILSGGPQSVYEAGSPQANPGILDLGIPVLGLCYGHQWLAHALGGKVESGKAKEYGSVELTVSDANNPLLAGLPKTFTVWMSHGDEVTAMPSGFTLGASTAICKNAVMMDAKRKFFGIQFHVEVTHTQHGIDILKRFCDFCSPKPWSMTSYKDLVSQQLKAEVKDRKVFMLVSGGVDSTVAFTLLNEVLGHDRVVGLLVDTGLMRKDEVKKIQAAMQKLGIKNLHVEDASTEFFAALKGLYEPEAKRKAIGDTFLAVQKRVSEGMGLKMSEGWMLGQGTIYPDTIETGGTKHADHIKTHHNRVEAVQAMIEKGMVIEPLKELYKDEVRQLGEELGLPHDLVWRHPFPGPGLGVRILCGEKGFPPMALDLDSPHVILPVKSVGVQGDGRTYRHALSVFTPTPGDEEYRLASDIPNSNRDISRVLTCLSSDSPQSFGFTPGYLTRELADLLRQADDIVDQVMRGEDLYAKVWQFPVVLLPIGLKKGGRSIVLRPINSHDAMTANAARLPSSALKTMTERIMALDGIDAVFLDLTNKPPATIEWE
jgi:GMP synthase (glutamine-hydrolysing)